MDNMKFWDKLRTPPKSALKKIRGGRLNGMTDIKPQWRYEEMTRTFGACGFGWKFEITNKWTENGSAEQVMCFVEINLFIKVGDKWSSAIPGIGGSTFIAKEKSGLHSSDECFKMATTDALSTALKMIGVGSDVYMGFADSSKYGQKEVKTDHYALFVERVDSFKTVEELEEWANKSWGAVKKSLTDAEFKKAKSYFDQIKTVMMAEETLKD